MCLNPVMPRSQAARPATRPVSVTDANLGRLPDSSGWPPPLLSASSLPRARSTRHVIRLLRAAQTPTKKGAGLRPQAVDPLQLQHQPPALHLRDKPLALQLRNKPPVLQLRDAPSSLKHKRRHLSRQPLCRHRTVVAYPLRITSMVALITQITPLLYLR